MKVKDGLGERETEKMELPISIRVEGIKKKNKIATVLTTGWIVVKLPLSKFSKEAIEGLKRGSVVQLLPSELKEFNPPAVVERLTSASKEVSREREEKEKKGLKN